MAILSTLLARIYPPRPRPRPQPRPPKPAAYCHRVAADLGIRSAICPICRGSRVDALGGPFCVGCGGVGVVPA
jgi:hypothetical protein